MVQPGVHDRHERGPPVVFPQMIRLRHDLRRAHRGGDPGAWAVRQACRTSGLRRPRSEIGMPFARAQARISLVLGSGAAIAVRVPPSVVSLPMRSTAPVSVAARAAAATATMSPLNVTTYRLPSLKPAGPRPRATALGNRSPRAIAQIVPSVSTRQIWPTPLAAT